MLTVAGRRSAANALTIVGDTDRDDHCPSAFRAMQYNPEVPTRGLGKDEAYHKELIRSQLPRVSINRQLSVSPSYTCISSDLRALVLL